MMNALYFSAGPSDCAMPTQCLAIVVYIERCAPADAERKSSVRGAGAGSVPGDSRPAVPYATTHMPGSYLWLMRVAIYDL